MTSSSRNRWLAAAALPLAVVPLTVLIAGCTPDAEPVPSPPVVVSTPAPTISPEPSDASTTPSPSGVSPPATPSVTSPTPSVTSPTPSVTSPTRSVTSAAPTPSTPLESSVAPRPERSKTPVELDEPATTGGLTTRLVSIRGIEAEARVPGEISGPALALTVEVTNRGTRAASLSDVLVNVLDADEAPGTELTGPPARPLPARVSAKAKVRGVYVFRVPENRRRPVTVTVSVADAPVLVFTGNAD